jgi:hypothetical protein
MSLLIDREARGRHREDLIRAAAELPRLTLNACEEADLELLANGAFSPLEGFLGEADYLLTRKKSSANLRPKNSASSCSSLKIRFIAKRAAAWLP